MSTSVTHPGQEPIDPPHTVSPEPSPAAPTIYCLPDEPLADHRNGQSSDRTSAYREVHRAQAVKGGMEARIDWDGKTRALARFDVRLADKPSEPDASTEVDTETANANQASEPVQHWAAVGNTRPGPRNDVLETAEKLAGKTFLLHLHRGPEHGDYLFAAKAVPVIGLPETFDDKFVAIRYPAPGHNYLYDGTSPALIDWTESCDEDDGVQRVTLQLEFLRDYELWVRLQSPLDPDDWLERDPIVRTGNGGGGQPT